MDDFVLVELQVQGKKREEVVHYVGKVISITDEGELEIDFLRMKSPLLRDTFHFPDIKDVDCVKRSMVLGVLVVSKGTTQRQADLIKIYPALQHFNMR